MKRALSSSPRVGRKVAVALSGGVDSSMAAYLLQSRPHDFLHASTNLIGIHMSNWDYAQEDPDRFLPECSEQEWMDAQKVAQHLNMEVQHASFTSEYWTQVFEPYCQGLSSGIMPNPDIDCNRYIKFGALKEYVVSRYGTDTVLATGHYARLWDPKMKPSMPDFLEEMLESEPDLACFVDRSENPTLLAALDTTKDQSYFLSGVNGMSFSNVIFPLGGFFKSSKSGEGESVRAIAKDANLPSAAKRESMGICMVGKRQSFGDFIQQYMPPPETISSKVDLLGKMISVEDGQVISTFDPRRAPNILYSSIGQGAKISGAAEKWFIVDKANPYEVIVCPGTHHPALYSDSLSIRKDDMNWIWPSSASSHGMQQLRAKCRIRNLQPLVDCTLRCDDQHWHVIFDKPLRGIAPGQTAAFYVGGDGLVCIGGGPIARRGPSYFDLGLTLPSILHPSGSNDFSQRKQKMH